MPSIRFVYFDLDDTLLDHRHAEKAALAELCDAYDVLGAHTTARVQEVYHAHNVDLWNRYSDGDLARDDLKRLRFELLLESLAVADLDPLALGEDYMRRYAAHWHFAEAARRAFDAVAARFPVGVLTNGFAEVQHAKLARFPEIRDRLATLVISEEVGFMKPHPKLFAHATAQAGVAPGEILYVGDSYHSDVRGSLAAGWQMAWYTEAAAPETNGHDRLFAFDAWPALLHHLGL